LKKHNIRQLSLSAGLYGEIEKFLSESQGHIHEADKHRNLNKGPDHSCKCDSRVDPEHCDSDGDGQLKIITGSSE